MPIIVMPLLITPITNTQYVENLLCEKVEGLFHNWLYNSRKTAKKDPI